MTSQTPTTHRKKKSLTFEIKSADLPVMALIIKTRDLAKLKIDLLASFGNEGENPGFFNGDLLLLDFSAFETLDQTVEENATSLFDLIDTISACGLKAAVTRRLPAAWIDDAQKLDLVNGDDAVMGRVNTPDIPTLQSTVITNSLITETIRLTDEETSNSPSKNKTLSIKTLLIEKPVRSGQKIYARGADLVIMAMVNRGAEVIADGNIHIYGALRGKAMAGAKGDTTARIFTLSLEPELVSIAGVYRTTEKELNLDVLGKPAQVRLSSDGQEKMIIEAMKP